MPTTRSPFRSRPSLSLVLLLILLATLWLAGGASRADALGQVVVRGVTWPLLVVAILFARPKFAGARPVWIIVLAALVLVLLQLVPLPPAIWTALPGRAPLLEASAASGQVQPWRPWSIVPGATLNAASSLVVPLTALLLATSLRDAERARLPGILLVAVVASAVLGLAQLSSSAFNNPFINETIGQVSGSFANRNHFALFMALGCPLTAIWAFGDDPRSGWRGPLALGLVLLFLLTILASGSRAGLALGVVALPMGLLVVRQPLRRALRHYPRWVLPALIAVLLGVVALFVLLSVAADRAVSISRLFALDQGQDMRGRGFPIVLGMIATYFPVGTGLGSFDPVFRMHEPFELLKTTYFNHAHNDLFEVVLDAGLPGALLLTTAIGWWGWASIAAWRTVDGRAAALPRLGSVMLLLVIAASIFDYPARTPMFMAVTVLAATWLSAVPRRADSSPLPGAGQHL